MSPRWPQAPAWVFYCLLLIAVSVTHYGGLSTHLFSTHDEEYLQDAEDAQGNIAFVVSPDRIYPGRPTHSLLLWGAYKVFHRNPAAYHILLVALHAACGLLLSLVAVSYGASRLTAWLAGLLFIACVAHFRVVHWIACFGYALALLFLLSVFLIHASPIRTARARWEVGALGLFALACFAHPASSIAALFPFLRSWVRRQPLRPQIRSALPLALTAAACLAALTLFYPDARQVEANTQVHSWDHLVRNFLWLWGRLTTTAFWYPKSLDLSAVAGWELWIGAAAIAGAIFIAWKAEGPVREWAAWTGLMILPFINSDMATNVSGPSRHLFLASAGFCFLSAWGILRLTGIAARGNDRVSIGLAAVVTLALLLSSGIGLRRAEALSLYHSGRYYISQEDYETGVKETRRAILHNADVLPEDAYLRVLFAGLTFGEASREFFRENHEAMPDSPIMRLGMAGGKLLEEGPQAREEGGRLIEEAVALAGNSRKFRVHASRVYNNIGTHYVEEERPHDAIRMYRSALKWYPTYDLALNNLADMSFAVGDTSSAEDALRRLLAQNPKTTRPYYRFGVHLGLTGQDKEAIAVFERSLLIDATRSGAYSNLGVLYLRTGEDERARGAFERAITLEPRDLNAHIGLAALHASHGQTAEALREYIIATKISPEREDLRRSVEVYRARVSSANRSNPDASP